MPVPAKTYEVLVEGILEETPSVKTFRLRLSPGAELSFRPGQFVMLYFPSNLKQGRAYSVASSPLEKGCIEISLNKVGEFTRKLFELRGGETMVVRGPYGKWFYTEDIPHAVLISGGTGVTPFRSIVRYVVQGRLPNRITMLTSSRTPEEILYREELDRYAKLPNFRILHTITRPQLMSPAQRWKGPTGRIDLAKVEEAVPDLFEAYYLLCGPNQLVEDLSSSLANRGVRRDRIRYEKWGEF